MAAKLITMPFLRVSGRIKLRGNRIGSPASGTHVSIPGLASLTALIPKLKCLATSGSVSPLSSLMIASLPMTSSSFATIKSFRSMFSSRGLGGGRDLTRTSLISAQPYKERMNINRIAR